MGQSKRSTKNSGSNANKTSDTASSTRNTTKSNNNNNKPKPVPTKQQAAQNIAIYAKQLLKLSRDLKGANIPTK